MLRDASLKDNEYYLSLQLSENDEFKIGGVKKDVEYMITFADKLIKPSFWDKSYQGAYTFGDYSTRKHEFMIEISGDIIDDGWWDKITGITGLRDYYVDVYKRQPSTRNPGSPPPRYSPCNCRIRSSTAIRAMTTDWKSYPGKSPG